jgi:hypothetical protein
MVCMYVCMYSQGGCYDAMSNSKLPNAKLSNDGMSTSKLSNIHVVEIISSQSNNLSKLYISYQRNKISNILQNVELIGLFFFT